MRAAIVNTVTYCTVYVHTVHHASQSSTKETVHYGSCTRDQLNTAGNNRHGRKMNSRINILYCILYAVYCTVRREPWNLLYLTDRARLSLLYRAAIPWFDQNDGRVSYSVPIIFTSTIMVYTGSQSVWHDFRLPVLHGAGRAKNV